MTNRVAFTIAVLVGLAGCGEAELEEVPETAEITSDEDVHELELDEETVLGADDIGSDIMATGWVSGAPLQNGFFLRTEDDRVIFVETDQSVAAGDQIRVLGPLVATQAPVFEGWEAEAFETGLEAEWDMETIAYIDAFSVSPIDGAAATTTPTGAGQQPGATDGDTARDPAGRMDEGVPAGDPGSKSDVSGD